MPRDIRLRVSLTHNGQMHVAAAATDNGHLTDDDVARGYAQPRAADYCHPCRGRPSYRRLAIRSPYRHHRTSRRQKMILPLMSRGSGFVIRALLEPSVSLNKSRLFHYSAIRFARVSRSSPTLLFPPERTVFCF